MGTLDGKMGVLELCRSRSSKSKYRSCAMGGLREARADLKAKRGPRPIWSTRIQWVAKGGRGIPSPEHIPHKGL